MFCPQCRLEQPTSHVYCARCGTPLPVDLVEPAHSKATRWFPGIKVGDEREQGYLRVSCYREDQVFDARRAP